MSSKALTDCFTGHSAYQHTIYSFLRYSVAFKMWVLFSFALFPPCKMEYSSYIGKVVFIKLAGLQMNKARQCKELKKLFLGLIYVETSKWNTAYFMLSDKRWFIKSTSKCNVLKITMKNEFLISLASVIVLAKKRLLLYKCNTEFWLKKLYMDCVLHQSLNLGEESRRKRKKW